MNKKLILISVLFFAVAIFAVFALANNRPESTNLVADNQTSIQQTDGNTSQEEPGIVLFYGEGCPHCAIVDEFVAENNIEAAVLFVKKEVYYNRQNADELVGKAQMCGIPNDSIGVPLLWDGSQCLVGDQDIIEFFKLKANQQ